MIIIDNILNANTTRKESCNVILKSKMARKESYNAILKSNMARKESYIIFKNMARKK